MSATQIGHRIRTAGVTVLDPHGHPLSRHDVVVEQRAHAFAFGNSGFELVPMTDEETGPDPAMAALWLDIFNTATLPFYRETSEPGRGRPGSNRLRRAAEWFAAHGCRVRGHPLVWRTLTAGERGRPASARLAVTAAGPEVTLLLNDFDVTPAQESLIESVLEAEVPVDALGLQCHMHRGYCGEERTLAILGRFARFGLPIHITETTLLSGDPAPPRNYRPPWWPSTPEGEQRQADEIVRHYRTLLSHPSVQAITYWGLSDNDSRLGAPCGLIRADGTPKPAYAALRGLVKGEWWLPPTTVRTDAAGHIEVRGFPGDYRLSDGARTASVTVTDTRSEATLRLNDTA
ncbi:endo-1,4-beta-xylanase [Paractinoplanes ovalisporus]|uniref:endo-1,4-beta-xylanase n=1 Tax=Paractinoplanes ovalisporus TaxID=2810368 RepID=UPI0027DBC2FC|nr:endo-1,4-beta-xylanase [Actinoplanes ovalisporus]